MREMHAVSSLQVCVDAQNVSFFIGGFPGAYIILAFCPQVCEAGLHISLGVGLRLFKLLEHELQLLDLDIALQISEEDRTPEQAQLVARLNQAQSLESEADSQADEEAHHHEFLTWFLASAEEADGPLNVQLRQMIQDLHKSAKRKVNRAKEESTLYALLL